MTRTGGGCLGWVGLLFCVPLLAVAAEPPTAPASDPGDAYVVKKGDTLWGIARDRLNDPVLWPRLWEQNPFIADPNRIYPGDTLSLPGREFAPAPVAQVPQPEPKAAPAPPPAAPAEPPTPAASPAPAEIMTAALPPVPPASPGAIACSPVLVPEAAAVRIGLGSILRGDESQMLMAQEDEVIVGLDPGRSVRVGDKLAITRTGLRVVHPWTRVSQGRIVHTDGILEVREVRDRTVRARVIVGCAAIREGDRVVEFSLPPFPEGKIAQPATHTVEGTILDSARAADLLALQEVVFLDVGKSQGIVPGDVFAIYRPNQPAPNPATGEVFQVPPERLGEAVVIRVEEATSTAVITASSMQSRQGDPVVLSRQVQP